MLHIFMIFKIDCMCVSKQLFTFILNFCFDYSHLIHPSLHNIIYVLVELLFFLILYVGIQIDQCQPMNINCRLSVIVWSISYIRTQWWVQKKNYTFEILPKFLFFHWFTFLSVEFFSYYHISQLPFILIRLVIIIIISYQLFNYHSVMKIMVMVSLFLFYCVSFISNIDS